MEDKGVTIIGEKALNQALNNLKANLGNINNTVINDLAELALSEMKKNYANADFQPGNIESTDFTMEDEGKGKNVKMSGPQVVYTEFGTGTRGALHPHEMKDKFSLNPYNDGPTIRAAKKDIITSDFEHIPAGTLYWTYKDSYGGIHYTQGIPAQKIVYNAGQTVLKKMKSIIKKRMEEQLKP